MYITYVHIYIEHRNPETRKTRLLSSGTKLFITFELKGFSTWERYHLSMLSFSSPPNHVRQLPQGLGERVKVNLLPPRQNSTNSFFKSSQILRARFRCMKSFTYPWSYFLSGIFIVTYVNDTSSPHAHQHLRSSLHLTNPCAKRKVLSLTKPQCRIYKTKSPSHYITTGHSLGGGLRLTPLQRCSQCNL